MKCCKLLGETVIPGKELQVHAGGSKPVATVSWAKSSAALALVPCFAPSFPSQDKCLGYTNKQSKRRSVFPFAQVSYNQD